MLIKDECDLEDPAKYEEINKILEEVDMSYIDWSKEDNKVKSQSLHSKDIFKVTQMRMP